jgi:polysaccharide export outer membrane protein
VNVLCKLLRPALLGVVAAGAAGCASSVVPSVYDLQYAPAVGEPTVNPGDMLRVTVWRGEEYSGEFMVTADGTLAHPLLKDVQIADITVSEATSRIEAYLARYIADPQVIVEPLYPVSILGGVGSPGLYPMAPETTIGRAIADAGGPTTDAILDDVRLIRDGGQWTVDLTVARTDYGGVPIRSGDQIFVRRKTFNFFRDVIPPVASLLGLTFSIINLLVILDRL